LEKTTPERKVKKADSALNDIAFELLAGDEYSLAEKILDYGINHTGKSSDLVRRMMVVNYANAIKLGGNKERAEEELAKFDWSASNTAFQISVAAVKDDIKAVIRQLPDAVKSGEINEYMLRVWPVFKKMRGDKTFQDKFKEIFNRDLISVVALDSKPALLASLVNDETGKSTSAESKTKKGQPRH
jgi:hypothetical protein